MCYNTKQNKKNLLGNLNTFLKIKINYKNIKISNCVESTALPWNVLGTIFARLGSTLVYRVQLAHTSYSVNIARLDLIHTINHCLTLSRIVFLSFWLILVIGSKVLPM